MAVRRRDMKKDKKKKKAKHEQAELRPLIYADKEVSTEEAGEEPLRDAVQLTGGKWKLRILWALRSGESIRYGVLKQQVNGITDMMLSQSLRELTKDGLTERRQFQEIPPKVEYRITSVGAELLPAIELFRAWAIKYRREEHKNG